MSGLFDPSDIVNQMVATATEALYKQVEGVEIIKCGKCQEPVLVADSRPKLLTPLADVLHQLWVEDTGGFEVVLCCPKCCREV